MGMKVLCAPESTTDLQFMYVMNYFTPFVLSCFCESARQVSGPKGQWPDIPDKVDDSESLVEY